MSEEDARRYSRFLTDLDLALFDLSGKVVDDHSQASDISPTGFRAQTQIEVKKGDRFRFVLTLDDGERFDGTVEVVWFSSDGWGTQTAGFKFLRIPWRARRLLRQTVPVKRYDFVALAKKAAVAVYVIVVAVGAHNIAFHQPTMRDVLEKLVPVMGALAVLTAGLFLLVW